MVDHRFTVRGADNKDYSADVVTVQNWVRAGRVTRDTMIFDRTSNAWLRAGDLMDLFAQEPPVVADMRAAQEGSNSLVGIIVIGVLGLIIWFCGGEVNGLSFATFLGVALGVMSIILLFVWFSRRSKLM